MYDADRRVTGRGREKSDAVSDALVSGLNDIEAKFIEPPVERREWRRVGGADMLLLLRVGAFAVVGDEWVVNPSWW